MIVSTSIANIFKPESIVLRVKCGTLRVCVLGSGSLPNDIVDELTEGHKRGSNLKAKRYAYWSVRICRNLERIVMFTRFDTLNCDVLGFVTKYGDRRPLKISFV